MPLGRFQIQPFWGWLPAWGHVLFNSDLNMSPGLQKGFYLFNHGCVVLILFS